MIESLCIVLMYTVFPASLAGEGMGIYDWRLIEKQLLPLFFFFQKYEKSPHMGKKMSVCPLEKFTEACYLLGNQDLFQVQFLSVKHFASYQRPACRGILVIAGFLPP